MLKTQIVIAIDPGTTESAYVGWDGRKILFFNKCKNLDLLSMVRSYDRGGDLIIEEINPYSMGKAIRDTIFWSGRFYEAWSLRILGIVQLFYHVMMYGNIFAVAKALKK